MTLVEILTEIAEGIGSVFVSLFQTMATIFFTVGELGAFTITPLGYMALIGLVLSIAYFVFRWIAGLFRSRGR